MQNKITKFEDLRIWKSGHSMTLKIYVLTKQFPKEELYGMTSQLRRASSSIPANIVEGFYRNSTKELINFLFIARGSTGEVIYFLLLAKDLNYIKDDEYIELRKQLELLARSINALIKSLKNK